MYLRIDEELYEKITNITGTDYEPVGEFLTGDSIIGMLEDLLHEYDVKNEQYEDLKQDIEENYNIKAFDPYEEYGLNKKDFH